MKETGLHSTVKICVMLTTIGNVINSASSAWQSLVKQGQRTVTLKKKYEITIPPERDMTQQWISVKDRLPEHKQLVLYAANTTIQGFKQVVTSGIFLAKDQWDRPNVFCDGAFHGLEWVTHWMPLPAPPGSEHASGPVSSGTPCTFKENPDRVEPL